jgi:hypothetical protein
VTEYVPIPSEIEQALKVFVGKLKEMSDNGLWPTDLEARTTLILKVMIEHDDPESQAEFMAVEELCQRSGNAEFHELPEGHTRRMRARRLARCLQRSLDDAHAREVAKAGGIPVPDEMSDSLGRFIDGLKDISPQWPKDAEYQIAVVMQLITSADAAMLIDIANVEDLFRHALEPGVQGAFYELPEGYTARDRARRLVTFLYKQAETVHGEQVIGNIGGIPLVTRDAERQRIRKAMPMIKAVDHVCPRCSHAVPTDARPGEYEGARSRTDHLTEICSPCGEEEGWQDRDGSLIPQDEWPVVRMDPPGRDRLVQAWEDVRSSNRRVIAPPPLPRELPDLRLHLMEKWIPGGPFEQNLVARGMSQGEHASHGAMTERTALRQASLWWIRDEMVRLTTAGAPSIPDDVRGSDIKLPGNQDFGLAVLGTPWVGLDAIESANRVQVDAFTWSPTVIDGHPCLSLSMYRYFDFSGGLGSHDLQEAIATGAVYDAVNEEVGNGSPDQRQYRMRGGSWVYMGRSDWPLSETLTGFEIIEEELPDGGPFTQSRKDSMIEDRKFFASFSVLVNHKLSETEMVWAPRSTRKRAERAGVDSKREPSHVRLIKLREIRKTAGETDAEHEKRKVNWSHRWMSSAHIGWRLCGPGKKERRLAFIPASVKGPEDKELIIKENVRVWTR